MVSEKWLVAGVKTALIIYQLPTTQKNNFFSKKTLALGVCFFLNLP